jgi:hypothetical protein
VGACIALAAILAIYVATHLALLWRFPWFVDETFYAVIAQAVQGDPAQRFVALIDHKGLINSWLGASLIGLDVPPMSAMRLLSIVSGAVAAGATGFLVWRWRGTLWAAVATTGLVAFVPYMFVHDSVGIYDPFIAAGSMIAITLQLELAGRQRLDLALLLGITFGILVLSKPTGGLAIILVPVSLLMFDWRQPRVGRRLAAWAGLIVLALLIAGCMYTLTKLSPLGYGPGPQNHRTVSDLFDDPFGLWATVAPKVLDAMWGYLTPTGIVLAAWGLVRVIVARDRLGAVMAVWAIAAIAAFLLLTDSAYPRYGLQAVAPLCVLMVIGGEHLWNWALGLMRWWWVAAVAVLATVPMLLLDARVLIAPDSAPYPGLDYDQYAKLVSNRQPVHEAATLIVRLADPASFTRATPVANRTVAGLGGWPWATTLVLGGARGRRVVAAVRGEFLGAVAALTPAPYTTAPPFIYVDDTSDHARVNSSRFTIVEGSPPAWLTLAGAHVVKTWRRPGGGPSVTLYDRGA